MISTSGWAVQSNCDLYEHRPTQWNPSDNHDSMKSNTEFWRRRPDHDRTLSSVLVDLQLDSDGNGWKRLRQGFGQEVVVEKLSDTWGQGINWWNLFRPEEPGKNSPRRLGDRIWARRHVFSSNRVDFHTCSPRLVNIRRLRMAWQEVRTEKRILIRCLVINFWTF